MIGRLYRTASRVLPSRLLHKLNIWKPASIHGREFRIPMLGALHLQDATLRSTWRTEVLERLASARDELFLDIGANLGQTLLDFRATNASATYIGFEPNPACVNYLNILVRINGWSDCQVIPVGLAARSGLEKFYLRPDNPTDDCGSLEADFAPGHLREVIYVPVFLLDEIRVKLPSQRIGFVKIDVERAEMQVLRGMSGVMRTERPIVLREVLFARPHQLLSGHEGRKATMMELLRRLDYSVFQLIKTPDNTRIAHLEELRSFPVAHQNRDTRDRCDYLFFPTEQKDVLANRLSTSSHALVTAIDPGTGGADTGA